MNNTLKDPDSYWRNCDLIDRDEVEEMVKRFYGDVAQDELLGHYFNDVAKVDWYAHIPKLVDFWCRMLFSTPGYSGNPMREHIRIHALEAFTHEAFQRWLELFQETIDMGWEGPNCDFIKQRAVYIGVVHSKALIGTPLDLKLMPIKKPN